MTQLDLFAIVPSNSSTAPVYVQGFGVIHSLFEDDVEVLGGDSGTADADANTTAGTPGAIRGKRAA